MIEPYSGFSAEKLTERPRTNWFWINAADAVNDAVTMGEVIEKYTPNRPKKYHEMACPFCGAGSGFYYTDYGYDCIYCGESGKPVDYVCLVLGLSWNDEAIRRIYKDFGLDIMFGRKETKENRINQKKNKLIIERKKLEEEQSNLDCVKYCKDFGKPVPDWLSDLLCDWYDRYDDVARRLYAIDERLDKLNRMAQAIAERKKLSMARQMRGRL